VYQCTVKSLREPAMYIICCFPLAYVLSSTRTSRSFKGGRPWGYAPQAFRKFKIFNTFLSTRTVKSRLCD
jgi:hypothetical protein